MLGVVISLIFAGVFLACGAAPWVAGVVFLLCLVVTFPFTVVGWGFEALTRQDDNHTEGDDVTIVDNRTVVNDNRSVNIYGENGKTFLPKE